MLHFQLEITISSTFPKMSYLALHPLWLWKRKKMYKQNMNKAIRINSVSCIVTALKHLIRTKCRMVTRFLYPGFIQINLFKIITENQQT